MLLGFVHPDSFIQNMLPLFLELLPILFVLINWLRWLKKKKKTTFIAEDLGLIRRLGRSPGEVNGYPLPYSCLENWTEEPEGVLIGSDRVKESDTTE